MLDFESLLAAFRALYWGLGPAFSLAFFGLIAAGVWYWLRASRECHALDFSNEILDRVLSDLENPSSELYRRVRSGVSGDETPEMAAGKASELLASLLRGEALGAESLRGYLHGVMTSPHAELGDDDRRVELTGARNALREVHGHAVLLGSTLPGITISLGLLGTITGMYSVFANLRLSDPSLLGAELERMMNSLSQAMFTTGLALILSIIMVLSTQSFRIRLGSIEGRLQEVEGAVRSARRIPANGAVASG